MYGSSGSSEHSTREELIAVLRGAVACPILNGLGEFGLLDQMLAGPFAAGDFAGVRSTGQFDATLTYLVSLGFLSRTSGTPANYEVTQLGRSVFTRYGSCGLLHSYRDYFERLAGMIAGADQGPLPSVDRHANVLGSGQVHSRKFFPPVYSLLTGHPFQALIDVGCGDGAFIAGLHRLRPDVQAIGVDLSEIAIRSLKNRFGDGVVGILADGSDVTSWLEKTPKLPGPVIISLWYVVHEFRGNSVSRSVEFFRELHTRAPDAELILGEIVNVSPQVLAARHMESIMPEFLLFHALSGQSVLTWEQHKAVLRQIPYTLACQFLFDELPDDEGGRIPSSFAWHLRPVG